VSGPDGPKEKIQRNVREIFGVHKEGWGRAGALRWMDGGVVTADALRAEPAQALKRME